MRPVAEILKIVGHQKLQADNIERESKKKKKQLFCILLTTEFASEKYWNSYLEMNFNANGLKNSNEEFLTNSSEDEGFKDCENVSIVVCSETLNLSGTSKFLLEQARLILEDHFAELTFIPATEKKKHTATGRRTHFTRKDLEESNKKSFPSQRECVSKISYDRAQLMFFTKYHFSLELPENHSDILDRFPHIVRGKDIKEQAPEVLQEKHFARDVDLPKITYKQQMLMFLARNRQSVSLPKDWKSIEERFPDIVYKSNLQEMEVFNRDPISNQDYIERRFYEMHV